MDTITDARLICFDNDGTLFASHEVANPAIQRTHRAFCRARGFELPPPTDEEICRLTGQPGHLFYREIMPEPLRDLAAEFREHCLQEEAREVLERGRFFDGVGALLADLRARGRKLALVTNAGSVYLDAVSRRLGYATTLDGIYHYGKDGLTTKAAMIASARRELGEDQAVMVGDRSSDLEGARGAGVPFVGCRYGGADELAGADLTVGSVAELRRVLLGNSPRP